MVASGSLEQVCANTEPVFTRVILPSVAPDADYLLAHVFDRMYAFPGAKSLFNLTRGRKFRNFFEALEGTFQESDFEGEENLLTGALLVPDKAFSLASLAHLELMKDREHPDLTKLQEFALQMAGKYHALSRTAIGLYAWGIANNLSKRAKDQRWGQEPQRLLHLLDLPSYDALDVVGEGSQSVIYLAKKNGSNDAPVKLTVFKWIDFDHLRRPDYNADDITFPVEEIFNRRIRFDQEVGHPLFGKILDSGRCKDLRAFEMDDSYFLVMDYVPDGIVEAKGKIRSDVNPANIVEMMIQLLEGVEAAHDKGYVLGDIRWANILKQRGEERLHFHDVNAAEKSDAIYFNSNVFAVGSRAYLPPEIRRQRDLHSRSPIPMTIETDLFQLATCTLYALIGDSTPLRNCNWMKQVGYETYIGETYSSLGLTPSQRSFFEKGLSYSPEKRFTSLSALRTAFMHSFA
ncbi:MAG: hypothetical protein WCV90_08620 [Candidatus Woesearchaeota archaeon]|jgi:hypothetical protein